jgi:hypothetical protein
LIELERTRFTDGEAMIIGFTGHQKINHPERWGWVREQFERVLRESAAAGDRAMSSLAAGGDQEFSEAAIAAGLGIEVVVPCAGYEATFKEAATLARYQVLLSRAARVIQLDYPAPSEDAFLAAGKRVADLSGMVVALWNGKAVAGTGGTGEMVAYARELCRPVVHINPDSLQVLAVGGEPDGR